ncbi:hypothetical protein CSC67_14600 [Pusillimonas caeni]|nr:hypothetical protein CSC67_14600 [Pusillimonas caeni]
MLPLIAGLDAGSIACCVGQSVLAVSFYPPALRTAGVGWAAALGRIGSIVGQPWAAPCWRCCWAWRSANAVRVAP